MASLQLGTPSSFRTRHCKLCPQKPTCPALQRASRHRPHAVNRRSRTGRMAARAGLLDNKLVLITGTGPQSLHGCLAVMQLLPFADYRANSRPDHPARAGASRGIGESIAGKLSPVHLHPEAFCCCGRRLAACDCQCVPTDLDGHMHHCS